MGHTFTKEEIVKLDKISEKIKIILQDYKCEYFIKYGRRTPEGSDSEEDIENVVKASNLCITVYTHFSDFNLLNPFLLYLHNIDEIDVITDWIDNNLYKDGFYNKPFDNEEIELAIPSIPSDTKWENRSSMNSPKPMSNYKL